MFIFANHKHLTMSDMAEELGIEPFNVRTSCKRMGIKPISVTERNENFLKEFHRRKTVAELSKAMGIQESQVRVQAERLGLPLMTHRIQPTTSGGRIIAAYLKEGNEAGHYIHPQNTAVWQG